MDAVSELEAIFEKISRLPDDDQFRAWNEVMLWLQQSMPRVAVERRQALHRFRLHGNYTRRQVADHFDLTFTTVSRLMDEVEKDESRLAEGA